MPGLPRNRRIKRLAGALGFTLIEVLVTLVISTGIVLLVTRVWQTVNQGVIILGSQGADWNTERFLRKQLLLAHTEPAAARLFDGRGDELMFVTRVSAAAGGEGPPVIAYYRYDAASRSLTYQERIAPPLWTSVLDQDLRPERFRSEFAEQRGRAVTLFAGLDEARFAFHSVNALEPWGDSWRGRPIAPRLLRIALKRAGQEKAIVMEWPLLISDAAPAPPAQ
jgi:prepilin-type N-terminal cleavage/methylation domain-containing protein